MKTLLLLIINLWCIQIIGQNLNTPEEFQKIVRNSRISYDIQMNDGKNVPKEARELLSNDLFIYQKPGLAPELQHYSDITLEKVRKNEEIGDELIDKQNYDKARKYLEKVLKVRPDHAGVMAKIGLTYFRQDKLSDARDWAKKAVKINPIHAPAHLLMANIFLKAGQRTEAMEAITLAHLFNRNHKEIRSKLQLIYKENGKLYDDSWEFYVPFQVMGSDSSKEVTVTYPGDPWEYYCVCQAVWDHEPFYAQKKKIVDADLNMLREKECLLNLIIDYEHWLDNKKKRDFKIGPVLQRAIEKQLIDEFIIYEILLVKNPEDSLMFTPEEIHRMAKYLFEVRSINIP